MSAKKRRPGSISISVTLAAIAVAVVMGPIVGRGVGQRRADDSIAGGYRIHRSGPMPSSWLTASGTDSRCWKSKTEERGFVAKHNAARQRAGRGNLKLDPELSKVARVHTAEMTSKNLLHHTSTESLKRRIRFWSVIGENVGVGSTVDSLHTAFMNSPAHRDNIMHAPYRNIGVGTASANGRLWVTVVFQASENPGTILRMPSC